MMASTGLTTLRDSDIARHLPVAQAMVTQIVLLEPDGAMPGAPIAGTGRRFVSTVSTAGQRRTRTVELARTIQSVRSDDPLLSPGQHAVLYRARRGLQVALAVAELFAQRTPLSGLQARNATAPLAGEDATRFRDLLSGAAYVAAFTLAAYLGSTLASDAEPLEEGAEPDVLLETPQDALKSLIAALDRTLSGAADETALVGRALAFSRLALVGLTRRRDLLESLAGFGNMAIRFDQDDFTLNGFDAPPGRSRKALAMTFRKPDEIIGNAIAKHQAQKLARMLMAYDFDRQMNPFVELGGFLFTFMGDGMPGTGKTMLIQMLAGLLNDYCAMAGYTFHYENFGVDQISSYQGKSGQNCKAFINGVLDPRVIGLGTIDDLDQVAARRSDDRASAGQQEVTAVLMESFAGASTVIRGNCAFGMFSNHPENVDDALRQRAAARWLVDGPQTRNDYIDIVALLIGRNHQIPLGDHTLYADQDIKRAVGQSYAGHERPQEERLRAVWEQHEAQQGKIATLTDIGAYLHRIKQAEPRFTGRAVKNITDAVKMRAMDVDLPDDWFVAPDLFLHRSYDEKKAMIEELRGPITLDMVLQEINRYADSEFRYTETTDTAAIADIVRREQQRERAVAEIEAMKREGRW